jgi:hypothetical protein
VCLSSTCGQFFFLLFDANRRSGRNSSQSSSIISSTHGPRLVGRHLCCFRKETDEVCGWTNPPSKKGKKAFYSSWLAELQAPAKMRIQDKDDKKTKFPESKTGKNIADWLLASHLKAGLKGEYIMCHSPDGASNAVASSMEFKAMSNAVKDSWIRHYTCYAHQVNRSAKYASGTGDFKSPAKIELAKVLKKLHEINGRVFRNETRLKALFAVQTKKNW